MKLAKEIPAPNRAMVKRRSGGVCEACGVEPAAQIHHRQYKKRGGTHDVSNLLHVCAEIVGGNVDGCHGEAHAGYRAESLGWAIRSGHDPEEVPVFRKSDRTWWRFDNDGGKEQIPAIDAMEYLVLIGAIREGMAS